MKKFVLLYIYCLLVFYTEAQNKYPLEYFISPIDSPLYLSGNFCTLRNDHFHYGIDITTYEKEGMPIRAVAEGYVSRVKVSPFGYGKAIYIDHPNGYTSVYAHLNRYNEPFARAVKDSQYLKESFEIEFFPKPGTWKVNQGDIIAYSGNSGGSSGPHLHFEIRDTKTEEIINPLLFGFNCMDTIAPEIKQVAVYSFNNHQKKLVTQIKIGNSQDTIICPKGFIGFESIIQDFTTFKAIAFNPTQINLTFDGKDYFHCNYERFAFDQAKMINVHINYDQYWKTGLRFQKLYIDEGNDLPFYDRLLGNGLMEIKDDQIHEVVILVYDIQGQLSGKKFYIRSISDSLTTPNDYNKNDSLNLTKNLTIEQKIIPQKSGLQQDEQFFIKWGEKSVYDTIDLQISVQRNNKFSQVKIQSNKENIIFSKPVKLGIKAPNIVPQPVHQMVISRFDTRGRAYPIGGVYENGFITTNIIRPDLYGITLDIFPPVVNPTNINKKLRIKGRYINFIIKDAGSGILKYKGKIDGKWVLMDYDAKNDWLTYMFDEDTPVGKHMFELEVTDKCNNTKIWKKEIIFPDNK